MSIASVTRVNTLLYSLARVTLETEVIKKDGLIKIVEYDCPRRYKSVLTDVDPSVTRLTPARNLEDYDPPWPRQ